MSYEFIYQDNSNIIKPKEESNITTETYGEIDFVNGTPVTPYKINVPDGITTAVLVVEGEEGQTVKKENDFKAQIAASARTQDIQEIEEQELPLYKEGGTNDNIKTTPDERV